MQNNSISVNNNVLTDEVKYNGETLLTYQIEYPSLVSDTMNMCMARINRYFRNRADGLARHAEGELFRAAVEQYKGDMAHGYPVRVFDVVEAYEVKYIGDCALSVMTDRFIFTGGAHGDTVRSSQNINLGGCTSIALGQLISCPTDYISYILSAVDSQIKKEPDIYFHNYAELALKNFNKNSFYLTDEGIVIYYQQYDIAPYSSGIREFFIPYGGCVFSPEVLCRP